MKRKSKLHFSVNKVMAVNEAQNRFVEMNTMGVFLLTTRIAFVPPAITA